MHLYKRYRRDIKHNLSFYIASIVLTVLSLLLFYLYYICGTGILDFTNTKFNELNIEDAHFSTYLEITDSDINYYEDEYDLILEKEAYLNIDTNGVNSRIFKANDKLDLHYILEGRDVINDDEIIITKGFALNNNYALNDKIKIKDKAYTIVGYCERPDYMVMIENIGDLDKNVATFYIAYLNEEAFNDLGQSNYRYLVKYNKDNHNDFKKAINDKYFMREYLDANDNIRIMMMSTQPELFIQMAYATLFTLPLMSVVLIAIILSRKIKHEQRIIGTLSAFGYSNKQIINYYAIFAALPGLIAGIITTILCWHNHMAN